LGVETGRQTVHGITLAVVAVRASREIVIDAPPEAILDALADVGVLSSWSPVHKKIEVLDRYADGRPHHVKVTIGILGIVDKEILEYHWGPDWVVWDAEKTFQQHGQHIEYTLEREGIDKTRVRFDITVEPTGPIPDFIVKRASKVVLDAATKGLRNQVMGVVGSDPK
jgi:carbon monoxide dehydrogenase subunit G